MSSEPAGQLAGEPSQAASWPGRPASCSGQLSSWPGQLSSWPGQLSCPAPIPHKPGHNRTHKRNNHSADKALKRQAGKKSVSVVSSTFRERALVRNHDKFWPMKRYRSRYGSPSLPQNKKLGHERTIIDGMKGVIVFSLSSDHVV